MSENYLVRTVGGPHDGTRVVASEIIPWPPPELLEDEGGCYVKVSQSSLDQPEPGSHVLRGAEYEWHAWGESSDLPGRSGESERATEGG